MTKKNWIWIILLILAIVLIAGAIYEPAVEPDEIDTTNGTTTEPLVEDGNDPLTYTDTEYNFSLSYPYDWQFASSTENFAPKFSAYIKPQGVPVSAPFDHFANVTHVSVYPQGIPTEGLFGQTQDLSFDPGFEVSPQSREYVLEDGTPFAAYLVPKNTPNSWGEAGFVWMRLRVTNLETTCLDGQTELPENECDPLTEGHQILWNGNVDTPVWSTEKEIVQSLSFEG